MKAGACCGAVTKGRHLGDLYNFAPARVSKTYGRNGTSSGSRKAASRSDSRSVSRLIPRSSPCRKQRQHCTSGVRPRIFPMMDVLMLGFAIGLFALAIGYTYACERL